MFKKIVLSSLVIALALTLSVSLVMAQETSADANNVEAVSLEEPEVSATDLETDQPGVLGWFKDKFRAAQILVTRDPVKKSELELKRANYQLLRVRTEAQNNPDDADLQAKLEQLNNRFEEMLQNINQRIEAYKNSNPDNSRLKDFLDKYTDQQLKQQEVLKKLEEKVPAQIMEKIRENREEHLERFGEVMTKLQNKEELKERLQNALQDVKEGVEKRIQKMEIIEEMADKAGTEIKEQVQELKRERMELFQELKAKREEIRENRKQLKEEIQQMNQEGTGQNVQQSIKNTQQENQQIRQENQTKRKTFRENILKPTIEAIKEKLNR